MWDNLIAMALQLLVAGVSFCVGKFLLPRLPKDTAAVIQDKMDLVITYADQYVNWADRFMEGSSGTEKLNSVVGQLKEVANRYGFQASDQELTAIAQTAFEKMSLEWDTIENGNKDIASAVVSALKNTAPANTIPCAPVPVAPVVPVNVIDQETINDANSALQEALEALEQAKATIADLRAQQAMTQQPIVQEIVEQAVPNTKQIISNNIANLRNATKSMMHTIAAEPQEEIASEIEPDMNDPFSIPDEEISDMSVQDGDVTPLTRTPTSLRELAASQAQQGMQAINAAARNTPRDDLNKYIHG